MGILKLAGSTSGVGSLVPPAIAAAYQWLFPAESGTLRSTVSPGTVLQIKHNQFGTATGALTGTFPFDNTIPQISEGNAISSLDTIITPQSATNWLIIEINLSAFITTLCQTAVALFQDSNVNALAVQYAVINTGWSNVITLRHKMLAGATSATTFKARVGGDTAVGSHVYLNGTSGGQLFGGAAVSSMTVYEIVP